MKLYLYDHCPFCVRVEMAAHYKKIPHEKVYLLNDDEANCLAMIGSKQVPILQLDDGQCIAESLDIARLIDQMNDDVPALRPLDMANTVTAHFDTVAMHTRCLLYPRNIMIGLPEFATQSARDYFQHKKEKTIARTFAQAMQETAEHQAATQAMLAGLPALPAPAQHDNTLGWDDIMIYPLLRNLTIVKGLQFPPAVIDYIESVADLTQTDTYFDRAV